MILMFVLEAPVLLAHMLHVMHPPCVLETAIGAQLVVLCHCRDPCCSKPQENSEGAVPFCWDLLWGLLLGTRFQPMGNPSIGKAGCWHMGSVLLTS